MSWVEQRIKDKQKNIERRFGYDFRFLVHDLYYKLDYLGYTHIMAWEDGGLVQKEN